MSREWKRGDVALLAGVEAVRAIWQQGSRQWATETGRYLSDWQVKARPLVVIDPEDREAVERLTIAYSAVVSQGTAHLHPTYVEGCFRCESARSRIVDDLQLALREYANPKPPKPDEPQGLGAVVEDAEGALWTRVRSRPEGHAVWQRDESAVVPVQYRDIDAVSVLSEGVQP